MRPLAWHDGAGPTVHLAMGGVALLLVLLLLITPILENGGASLGSTLLSRAELEVDAFPNGTLVLYVLSSGNVRFSSISLGTNTSLPGVSGLSVSSIKWTTWYNSTDRVTESVMLTNVSQFAVNITAKYLDPTTGGSNSEYISWGVYAFQITYTGTGSITDYPLSASLPTSSPRTFAFSQLPQTLALAERTVSYV